MEECKTTNPAIIASQEFDSNLRKIQDSNLNYQIKLSPFSAVISLKKSLIKDKSGQVLFPYSPSISPTIESLQSINQQLKMDIASLETKILQK